MNGFKFLEEIGNGAMARVYKVEQVETQEIGAAKVYNNQQMLKATLANGEPMYVAVQREIDILSKLSHRYIITMMDVFNDEETDSLIIVLPFAPLGNFQTQLDKEYLSPEEINTCYHQIAIGLEYLHDNNIVHRDIKPDNFLVFNENYYVLSDFSVSQELNSPHQKLIDTKGSPAFLSPEECSGKEFDPKAADVWSYGISLYNSVFNDFPFELSQGRGQSIAATIMIVADHLQRLELTFPEGLNIDPVLIDLITKILQKDPEKRLTFTEIKNHPWFKDAWEIDEQNIKMMEYYEEEDAAA